jgi:hypothetical protein
MFGVAVGVNREGGGRLQSGAVKSAITMHEFGENEGSKGKFIVDEVCLQSKVSEVIVLETFTIEIEMIK